jgi:hypothetical protein
MPGSRKFPGNKIVSGKALDGKGKESQPSRPDAGQCLPRHDLAVVEIAMRHFLCCDLCGTLGHGAANCPLRDLEARQDPMGEIKRRESYRLRERERLARKQNIMSLGSVQSSRSFGL